MDKEKTWEKERGKIWGSILDLKKQIKILKMNGGTNEVGGSKATGIYPGGNPTDTLKEGAPGRA